MSNHTTIRKWSELYKMQAYVPQEGRSLGVIEDFYFKTETNAVYALGVSTRVDGARSLPVTGIKEIGTEHIDLINSQMLTRAIPPLPKGSDLHKKKVVGENGRSVGTVGEIWLATDNPITLRIASIALAGGSNRKTFTTDEIVRYDEEFVVVYDSTARRLQ